MNDLSPYIRPGITITEADLISMIRKSFDFKDDYWVKTRNRKQQYVIARQLLMTCLHEFLGYNLHQAGSVCWRDHATAFHSRQHILDLMDDCFYGKLIRPIYEECKTLHDLR